MSRTPETANVALYESHRKADKMATIRPFHGVRYNPTRIPDLSSVISQPHDRVRHGLQDRYYDLSPHNVVRLIKGRRLDGDGPDDNIYTRSRDTYSGWLRDGVLIREESPAFYLLRQTFRASGGEGQDAPSSRGGARTRPLR